MKAWQFSSAKGGIENNMHLNSGVNVPSPKPNQLLVRVVATSLNPLDFKPAEGPGGRFIVPNPAIPGVDIVGEVVKSGSSSTSKVGSTVFGQGVSIMAGGGMAEYALISTHAAVPVPNGVEPTNAVSIPIAGQTAYQSIEPYVKVGSRVFINGGSGGTGVFGIQIAKALGCHVTTSCSTANVDLCKSLGADEVLDYKKASVLEQLKKQQPFDHVIDNVFSDHNQYWKAHEYTNHSATYVLVGATPSLGFILFMVRASILPGFLGGGKRKLVGMFAKCRYEEMERIVNWMAESKVKPVIDSKYTFEQGAEAMRKMKSGRAKGKIVVEVAPEAGKA